MKTSWPPYPSPSKGESAVSSGVTVSLGHPILLHWLALAGILGLLLLAAVRHMVPLLAATIFLLVLAVVSRLWSWRSLQEVTPRLTLDQNRAFPGEKIGLTFEVTNAKWLFLPWLEVEAELPWRLVAGRVRTPGLYGRKRLCWTAQMGGRQRVSWKHSLECKTRGDYALGPLRLRCGDVFGLFPEEMIVPRFEHLLVYPQIVSVDKVSLPFRELVGESGVPRSVYEDVSRTVGSRDYHYEDPLKRIHWKASASHAELQTRQYEYTTSLSLLLMLDVYSFCQPGEAQESEELFELAVTTVASLAYRAHRENFAVGLMANSVPEIQLPIGSSRSHLILILESLARVQARSQTPLHEQLDKYRASLPMGASPVIATRGASALTDSLAHMLQREGFSPLIINIGDKAIPVGSFDDVRRVSVQSLSDLSPGVGGAGR